MRIMTPLLLAGLVSLGGLGSAAVEAADVLGGRLAARGLKSAPPPAFRRRFAPRLGTARGRVPKGVFSGAWSRGGRCEKGSVRLGRRCVRLPDARPCPRGWTRLRGRCVRLPGLIVTPPSARPCPRGRIHLRGRCIRLPGLIVTPPRDTGPPAGIPPLVGVPPAGGRKPCPSGYERRGKRCFAVTAPGSPRKSAAAAPPRPAPPNPPSRFSAPPPSEIPPAIGALTQGRPHRPREIIVLVASAGAAETATALSGDYNLVADESAPIALLGGVLVRLGLIDNRPIESVLALLANDARVLAFQPNYVFEANEAARTKAGKYPQYAPDKIRIGEAHRIAKGRGVRIAIIDTGVDEGHPEIAGAVAGRYDALGEGAPHAEAHGTAVAGVVTARAGLEGIAPEAAVLCVRAFRGDGAGPPKSTSFALVKGIDWAFAEKARLFNMSFAGPLDPLLGRVIEAAEKGGAIFVAAGGNGGPDASPAYPAAFAQVIAVTATDDGDRIYANANRGAYISLAAPGVDILSAAPDGKYEMSSGTSIATAHVSGVIALMLERNPGLAPMDVRAILDRTARRPDGAARPEEFGAGVVDAARALGAP